MRDEGHIVLIIDRSPLRKAHQHFASGADLPRTDKKVQFAGADDKNSAQYCSLLNDRREGHDALIVDCGKAEAVKGTAARGWIPTRHEFTQDATTIQIQHLQRFPASPDSSHKSDIIAIVQHRRIEIDKGAVSHTGRVRPAQCY